MSETLLSIGIDIGTTTTQMILSKLKLENMSNAYSVPKMVITEKEVIYRSEIYLTPLLDDKRIDYPAVGKLLKKEYEAAGIQRSDVDTGAVIITGETARKDNAETVTLALSDLAGDFVVAAAGPDLESMISGKGAGAENYSKEHKTDVINLDIGGGTTNLSYFHLGHIQDTGCLDRKNRVSYISEKLQRYMQSHGISMSLGEELTETKLQPILQLFVSVLEEAVGLRPVTENFHYFATKAFQPFPKPKCISFSGGVADIFYHTPQTNSFAYGDIGIYFGRYLKENFGRDKEFQLIHPSETIRATVIGAGSYTTKLSGSTISYTKNIFPMKNVPVLKLSQEEEIHAATVLSKKYDWFQEKDQNPVIAFQGISSPSFFQVAHLAKNIADFADKKLPDGKPLLLVMEEDMAKVLGQSLASRVKNREVVCLDGIGLENGDYIDLGIPAAGGTVLPVVVKTLAFGG